MRKLLRRVSIFVVLGVALFGIAGQATPPPDEALEVHPVEESRQETVPAEVVPSDVTDDHLPDGFVDIRWLIPDAVLDIRYFGTNNFVGRPIDGYEAPVCILTLEAALALQRVQKSLEPFGLGIKIFDCYRPQRAVDHFVRWAADPDDTLRKADFYPEVDKSRLFELGYIAERSGHTRGSTVDLTLIDKATGEELDMGSPFDFFGPISWPHNMALTGQQRANRALLRSVMVAHGFKPYEWEWWHFTLVDEPYPDTYFDFPVRNYPLKIQPKTAER